MMKNRNRTPAAPWAILMLVTAAAMAGCFGLGDDSDPDSDGGDATPSPSPGNETTFHPPPNGTTPPPTNNTTAPPHGNGTFPPPTDGNETSNGTLEWSYDNRTGTVSGTALLLIGSSSEDEVFTIENGTVQLLLNFSVEGSALDVEITPPGCEDDACRVSVDVGSGQASYAADDPAEGEWTITFSSTTSVGSYSADYGLDIAIATMVEAEPADDGGLEDPGDDNPDDP